MSAIEHLKSRRKTAIILSMMGVATALPRIAGLWGEPGSHWPNSLIALIGALFALYYHVKLKDVSDS